MSPSKILPKFSDFFLGQLHSQFGLSLESSQINFIQSSLNDFEQRAQRKFEERDQMINQLKQNLLELTEKRFRNLNQNGNSEPGNLINNNMQYVLNEKDVHISQLVNQINEKEKEIVNLKKTIKEQDDIILSHNNNIYVNKFP